MVSATEIVYYLFHLQEFRSIVQWFVLHLTLYTIQRD